LVAFGLSSYWGPLASRKIGSLETVMLTRIIILILMLAIFFVALYRPVLITAYEWLLAVLTGFFVVLATVAYYWSTKKGHIAIFSAVSNSWAVVTIILDVLFLGSSINLLEAAVIALLIIGTILVSFKLKDIKAIRLSRTITGFRYAILSAAALGISFFTTNLMVFKLGWFLPVLLANIFMVIFSVIAFKVAKVSYARAERPSFALVILVAIALIVAIFAYDNGVIVPQNVVIVAPIAAAAPALTAALAVIRLKEKLEINQYFGIAAIVIGLVALAL